MIPLANTRHNPLAAICFMLLFYGCGPSGTQEKKTSGITETICFESTSPDASKKTPLYDYLRLSFLADGSIEGQGGGFVMEGGMKWITNVKGSLKGDTLTLKVTYQVKDPEFENPPDGPFTASETWYFDKSKKHLWRMECFALKNYFGEKEYHRIECTEIPEQVDTTMQTIRLR